MALLRTLSIMETCKIFIAGGSCHRCLILLVSLINSTVYLSSPSNPLIPHQDLPQMICDSYSVGQRVLNLSNLQRNPCLVDIIFRLDNICSVSIPVGFRDLTVRSHLHFFIYPSIASFVIYLLFVCLYSIQLEHLYNF